MRVLFISANTYKDPYPIYPLGISYLKTAIDHYFNDEIVEVADMNFISIQELQSRIKSTQYDYICVSMRNIDNLEHSTENKFVLWYKELIASIREISDKIIIGGGAGYSIFPKLLLKELNLDFGIKGEGESSLSLLLDILFKNSITKSSELKALTANSASMQSPILNKIYEIEGIVYRDYSSEIHLTERKNYEKSIDLLFDNQSIDYYWKQSGMLNIQTKRGCPHHCIYCSYPIIEGRVVRTLDTDKIVSVLINLYTKHNINYLFFTDSVFNMKRSYNYELCNKIIDSGIKINWGAYFAPNKALTFQDLQLYKKAGLTHIEFGTESFCTTQLKNYGKNFTWEDVLEKSQMCNDLGIFYSHFMILAGYGETEQTLVESYEHSKLLDNTVIFPYIGMRIYPGTLLSSIAIKEGQINDESELLAPHFYISKDVDISKIEQNAKATGANWVFPNDPPQKIIEKYRKRDMKGPLWEYLRFSKFINGF